MKPDAPEGIRGEFKPIDTNVPGIRFCEHLPALAAARRQARGRADDVARAQQPPQRHPPGPDRPAPAGRLLRQGGLARRLPPLRRDPGLPPPQRRRHPLRRPAADVPGRRPADLAGAARRVPRRQVRPLADPQGPERGRLPRGPPLAARRLQRRAARRSAATCWASWPPSADRLSAKSAGDSFSTQREMAYSMLLSGKVADAFQIQKESDADPRPLRPAHLRPVAPAGAAAGRGGRADRPGQHGPRAELGHARRQLRAL